MLTSSKTGDPSFCSDDERINLVARILYRVLNQMSSRVHRITSEAWATLSLDALTNHHLVRFRQPRSPDESSIQLIDEVKRLREKVVLHLDVDAYGLYQVPRLVGVRDGVYLGQSWIVQMRQYPTF